jgi:hypothetical protein
MDGNKNRKHKQLMEGRNKSERGFHLAGLEKAAAVVVAGGMSKEGLPPARTAVIGSSWSSQSLSSKGNLDKKVR